MSLADWILANGIWLGFKTGYASSMGRRRQWGIFWLGAALVLVFEVQRHLVDPQAIRIWWLCSGGVLEIAAWRSLRGHYGVGLSDFIETVGAAICLGLGTGLWLSLSTGLLVGGLLSLAVSGSASFALERLAPVSLGAVGLNDLWAGIYGNLPAHQLSWFWALPWLIAGELLVIFSDERQSRPPIPLKSKPRWPRRHDFAR